MKFKLITAIAMAFLLSCSTKPSDNKAQPPLPEKASAAPERPYLIYQTRAPQKGENSEGATFEVISEGKWRGWAGRRKNTLKSYLQKFFYAHHKDVSQTGKFHRACYMGNPLVVESAFFSRELRESMMPQGVSNLELTQSTDGLKIGVKFRDGGTNRQFNLPSCKEPGKNELISLEDIAAKIKEMEVSSNSLPPPPSPATPKALKTEFTDFDRKQIVKAGFGVTDTVSGNTYPKFKLIADYEKAKTLKHPTPWRGLDLSTSEGRQKLAAVLKDYVYDGLMNQNLEKLDFNFIADKDNKGRYFCHMPWLNTGAAGREGIHGLTKERDLRQSDIYKDAPSGADYGIAVFNGFGCQTIHAVFGTEKELILPPAWQNSNFPNGTLIAKILFTTAQWPAVDGALKWNANVSLPHSQNRKVRPVAHIQMDIAVKDEFKGIDARANNWIMSTYYYDNSYTPNSYEKELMGNDKLHKGLLKMRPVGIQWGFTKNESDIFPGAITNNGHGLLNGPADNFKSSCMSCHGVAGTNINMVPGITSLDQWIPLKNSALDFNQQLALARRNFEATAQ